MNMYNKTIQIKTVVQVMIGIVYGLIISSVLSFILPFDFYTCLFLAAIAVFFIGPFIKGRRSEYRESMAAQATDNIAVVLYAKDTFDDILNKRNKSTICKGNKIDILDWMNLDSIKVRGFISALLMLVVLFQYREYFF